MWCWKRSRWRRWKGGSGSGWRRSPACLRAVAPVAVENVARAIGHEVFHAPIEDVRATVGDNVQPAAPTVSRGEQPATPGSRCTHNASLKRLLSPELMMSYLLQASARVSAGARAPACMPGAGRALVTRNRI